MSKIWRWSWEADLKEFPAHDVFSVETCWTYNDISCTIWLGIYNKDLYRFMTYSLGWLRYFSSFHMKPICYLGFSVLLMREASQRAWLKIPFTFVTVLSFQGLDMRCRSKFLGALQMYFINPFSTCLCSKRYFLFTLWTCTVDWYFDVSWSHHKSISLHLFSLSQWQDSFDIAIQMLREELGFFRYSCTTSRWV